VTAARHDRHLRSLQVENAKPAMRLVPQRELHSHRTTRSVPRRRRQSGRRDRRRFIEAQHTEDRERTVAGILADVFCMNSELTRFGGRVRTADVSLRRPACFRSARATGGSATSADGKGSLRGDE